MLCRVVGCNGQFEKHDLTTLFLLLITAKIPSTVATVDLKGEALLTAHALPNRRDVMFSLFLKSITFASIALQMLPDEKSKTFCIEI